MRYFVPLCSFCFHLTQNIHVQFKQHDFDVMFTPLMSSEFLMIDKIKGNRISYLVLSDITRMNEGVPRGP